jgi:tRNA-dihydrouridine synthase A
LCEFVQIVSERGGCDTFIIHARKAWLSGLSPKQNREIPPLDYPRVYQLKKDFPHLQIILNGGIKTLLEVSEHLKHVDGVMVGREAYQNPALLCHVDHNLFDPQAPITDPVAAIHALYPYIEQQRRAGTALGHITRHIVSLFQGIPGARQWRRHLSENAHQAGAGLAVVQQALALIIGADTRTH